MQSAKRAWTIGRLALIVPILVAGLAVAGVRPAAAAFSCTTQISDTTIRTPVVVPAGANCALIGVVVLGGVTVNQNAVLTLARTQNLTEIRGNVTANRATALSLNSGVTIRGNLSSSGTGFVGLTEVAVRGNTSITGSTQSVSVGSSTFSASLTVSNNTASSSVTFNTITVNLICENNTPPPTATGNSVGNQTIGQCVEDEGGDS